jgi:signal transduction histidine kinase
MTRTPFDDLVHRVNNLLATISIQAELARGDGTLAAFTQALASIAEAAERTGTEVQRLRQRADGDSA